MEVNIDILKGNDPPFHNNVRHSRQVKAFQDYSIIDTSFCKSMCYRLSSIVFHATSLKFFLWITSMSFILSIFITHFIKTNEYKTITVLQEEAIRNVGLDYRYTEVYKRKQKISNEIKYILEWTPKDYEPLRQLRQGKLSFIKNNCSYVNCFVTDDRDFFNGDLTKFDVIAFNGRNILNAKESDLPRNRSPHQKYIYFNMESSDNYPLCNPVFDGFFNLTATYKLNSDIQFSYIQIRDRNGEVVGPRIDMKWAENMTIDEDLSMLNNKSKAAAWFVSNCNSRNGRKELGKKLQEALEKYGLAVDIYGKCGPFQCPRNEKKRCNEMLEKDYFFYLSFENSFAEDYVTEKVLTPLHHNAVPIVFGGGNYSRFLPPDTYLDARLMTPEDIASTVDRLMRSPEEYRKYFRWKSYYTYRDPSDTDSVCAVCELLNNESIMQQHTVYNEFRAWWNPDYKQRCNL
ncbi:PREDICTED: alpha-(1,3)-fucosyltransferase C-like isoform X2 [Papilio polytes]|uniref:alpha-(1,3)-fucosyltransferase C-like isoform X2 n=1 Tax=Papilio polytes TaxID=76194 RepID=UPI000675DDAF|nr:PREDICTED: alpha-(1,3)-fucosyltransferase C-like isoform X2 [Papilio polytes]